MTFVKGAIVALIVFYLAVVGALWFLQTSLIYPAPQDRFPTPDGFSEIMLKADDGIVTRALYHGAEDGQRTVLFYHGNGQTLGGSLAATRVLVEQGYGVMLPEFRGYGGNDGSPSEEGFYRDGRAALAWLLAQGVGPDQTVISAFSIGTGAAAQLAVEHRPAALMLNAPFRSLSGLAAQKLPWLPVRWLIDDKYETEEKLAAFDRPLLVTHGAIDSLIPPSHGLAVSKAVPNPDKSVFLRFEGLGHDQMLHDDVLRAQAQWLEGLEDL